MSKRSDKLRQLDDLEADLRKRGQPHMASRAEVENELQLIEKGLRDLISTYEQYFMGIGKFEPARERQLLTYRLRRMTNIYIPQADLRFRLQGLASRMQSYAAYWDRILRQIEEGRYIRQRSHMQRGARFRPEEAQAAGPLDPATQHERVYHDLIAAYASCKMAPPPREQFEAFLHRQGATIREQFGDQPVDLIVVVQDGKPKLRVRARN